MSSLAASVEGIIRINIFLDSTHLTVVRLLMFVALCAVYAIVLESNFEITYQVVIKMCNSLNSMTILSNSTRRCLSLYVTCVHAVVRAASAYLSTRSVSTAGNLQIRRNFEKVKEWFICGEGVCFSILLWCLIELCLKNILYTKREINVKSYSFLKVFFASSRIFLFNMDVKMKLLEFWKT